MIAGAAVLPAAPLLVAGVSAALPDDATTCLAAIDGWSSACPRADAAVLLVAGDALDFGSATAVSLEGYGRPDLRLALTPAADATRLLAGLGSDLAAAGAGPGVRGAAAAGGEAARDQVPAAAAVLALQVGGQWPVCWVHGATWGDVRRARGAGGGARRAVDGGALRRRGREISPPGSDREVAAARGPAARSSGTSRPSRASTAAAWRPWRSSGRRRRSAWARWGGPRSRCCTACCRAARAGHGRAPLLGAPRRRLPRRQRWLSTRPSVALVGPTRQRQVRRRHGGGARRWTPRSSRSTRSPSTAAWTSARPSPRPRTAARVPHHMVDVLEPEETVHRRVVPVRRARGDRRRAAARGSVPLLVGGSGLYFRAVVDPLEFPPTDPVGPRARSQQRYAADPAAAHAELQRVDPEAAAPHGPRATCGAPSARWRCSSSPGGPFSDWRRAWDALGVASTRGCGSSASTCRPTSAGRPDRCPGRRDARAGWLEECGALRRRRLSTTARQAIGYAELLDHLDGDAGAGRRDRSGSRSARGSYAARQDRWFRRRPPGTVDAAARRRADADCGTAMHFVKVHGAGNDFVLLPDLDDTLTLHAGARRSASARRHLGHRRRRRDPPRAARATASTPTCSWTTGTPTARIAEMCGNGVRCVAKYVADRDAASPATSSASTRAAGVKAGRGHRAVPDGLVDGCRVDMGAPVVGKVDWPLDVDGETLQRHHAVDGQPARGRGRRRRRRTLRSATLGPRCRRTTAFPDGTNVEVITVAGPRARRAAASGSAASARRWPRARAPRRWRPPRTCSASPARQSTVALPGGDLHVDWTDDTAVGHRPRGRGGDGGTGRGVADDDPLNSSRRSTTPTPPAISTSPSERARRCRAPNAGAREAQRIEEGAPREGVAIFRPVEKAVLVALHLSGESAHEVDASLDELELLVDTAGSETVGRDRAEARPPRRRDVHRPRQGRSSSRTTRARWAPTPRSSTTSCPRRSSATWRRSSGSRCSTAPS